MHNNNNDVVGFKIGIRLVDDEEKVELDVTAGEVARDMDNNDKIFKDQWKQIREGKDMFDTILLNAIDSQSNSNISCCMLQIAGWTGW
ncbi:hypothetical protein BJV82DRAFT_667396 [Fennellomyces sp. T-0311]|nr:hypothetical protein BJV82DRAFT_667396 [Fennellomyces sp. T-0311]